MDREETKKEYDNNIDNYKRLGINLQESLKYLLNKQKIPNLDVQYRLKDFDSYYDKIERKKYNKPLDEIEDICGLKIICYYPSDIDRVISIIKKELIVIESQDKSELLEPDKFGYRSVHFIVVLKNDWLKAPNFRELGDLKAEIQVRTILMHAWADISHKLSYKKKEHIPELFQRKLFQLSALFEIADDRFESLRKEREEYINNLVIELETGNPHFNSGQEMNLDSLQTFLDFYFPDRTKDIGDTTKLLDEIIKFNITFEVLHESFEKVKNLLPEFEKEIFDEETDEKWAQVGIVRYMLDLTCKEYFNSRRDTFKNFGGLSLAIREEHIKRTEDANSK